MVKQRFKALTRFASVVGFQQFSTSTIVVTASSGRHQASRKL